MFVCTDGGEEQAATGEAGARRTEAAADHEEGRDAAGGGGRTGPEDSSPHQGSNTHARTHTDTHTVDTFPQMPSSLDFSIPMFKCARGVMS